MGSCVRWTAGDRGSAVDTGLDGRTVYCVASTPDGRVLAGTSAGCLVSADSGATWRVENDGLTNLDVYCLTVDAAGDIVAGTNGGGVFRSGGDRSGGRRPTTGSPTGPSTTSSSTQPAD